MNVKINNWFQWFYARTKEFSEEYTNKKYEIVDDYTCTETGKKKVVIKVSGRHVEHKFLDQAILSDDFINGFDGKTIRALSCAAIAEKMMPEYIICSESEINQEEPILKFKAKNGEFSSKLSSDTCQDRAFLSKLSSLDAHKIGYIAGINKTLKEFQAFKNVKSEDKDEI